MKTTIPKENILRSLVGASKFTTGIRVQNENLGIFLVFRGKSITVIGIQETKFFQETIDCDIQGDSQTVVTTDSKKLIEFLQNIPESSIQISLETNGIKISGGKTNALFPISTKSELPEIPHDSTGIIALDPKVILTTLPQLLFCIASDSARPTLSSIKCIPQEDNKVLLVTTDGFRLSIVQTSLPSSLEQSIQIPATFLRDVFLSVVDQGQKVNLVFHGDGRISLRQNNIVVGTQLVNGDFPPYERVMVRNYQQNIIISRKELVQATKTIAIFTREHSNIVVCEIARDTLKMRPKKEAGSENNTELTIEMQGQETEGLVLAFNYRYLLDFLSSVEDDFITMRVNRPDSPVLFLAGKVDAADSHEGAAYRHIIMPVRIQE
jgi:DNA polymerase-3 subunit beta